MTDDRPQHIRYAIAKTTEQLRAEAEQKDERIAKIKAQWDADVRAVIRDEVASLGGQLLSLHGTDGTHPDPGLATLGGYLLGTYGQATIDDTTEANALSKPRITSVTIVPRIRQQRSTTTPTTTTAWPKDATGYRRAPATNSDGLGRVPVIGLDSGHIPGTRPDQSRIVK